MTDRHLTLLELHLHDSEFQLGPRALGGDDEADAEADAASEESPAATGSSSTGLGLLALALVLVAVGVAVKRLLDGEDLESLEDLDVDSHDS